MKRQKTALLQSYHKNQEDEDGDLLLGQIKATGLFHFLWPSLALARNYQSHLSLYLLFAQIGKCCDCPTFHYYLKAKLYSMYLTIQSRDVATISKLFFQQGYLNAKTAQRERDPDSRLSCRPPRPSHRLLFIQSFYNVMKSSDAEKYVQKSLVKQYIPFTKKGLYNIVSKLLFCREERIYIF